MDGKINAPGHDDLGIVFLFDVFIDLYEHYSRSQPYSNDELVHLLFELGAVVALILGMFSLLQYNNLLRSHNELATQQLSALQKDFERHVHSKFDFWEFTAAERDIALLLLKGFSTASISEFRATQIGTVKVQVHNLLKKARLTLVLNLCRCSWMNFWTLVLWQV